MVINISLEGLCASSSRIICVLPSIPSLGLRRAITGICMQTRHCHRFLKRILTVHEGWAFSSYYHCRSLFNEFSTFLLVLGKKFSECSRVSLQVQLGLYSTWSWISDILKCYRPCLLSSVFTSPREEISVIRYGKYIPSRVRRRNFSQESNWLFFFRW